MTSTPERKDSTSSVNSTKGLVFGSVRRYSRAYEQPFVQNTSKGPKVRVEMEDGTSIDLSRSTSKTSEGFGMVLNPEAAVLGSLFAKIGIGTLSLIAFIVSVISKTTLLAASQLFGFMFMFGTTFAVSVGLFFWWSTFNRETVPLTNRNILYLFASSLLGSVLSQVLASYTAIPIASSLPHEASYYVFYVTMLFIVLSLVAHRDSLNGMFSQETCIFVGLTVVLDFVTMCLFGDILPGFIYSLLPLCSMLSGMCLSLATKVFPYLSPSGLYRALRQGSHHRTGLNPLQGGGGRQKKISDISMESGKSSLYPRNSVSSVSSYSYANQSTHESELITEAHGLISDLLLTKESLNSDAQTKLKRVVELLNPRMEKVHGSSRRVFVGNHIGYDRHDYEDDVHTPYSDHSTVSSATSNRLSVAGKAGAPKHRNSTSVYQRQSVSTFSVATSASGMPVLDTEPIDRKRSVAIREVRARISVQEKRPSVHKMGRERLGSFERLSKPTTPTRAHSPHSPLTRCYSSTSTDAKSDGEMSDAETQKTGDSLSAGSSRSSLENRQPVATPPESPNFVVGSGKLSLDGSSTLGVISEEGNERRRPRSYTAPSHISPSPLSGQIESKNENDSGQTQTQFWTGRGTRPANGYIAFSNFVQPPDYDIKEYNGNSLTVLEQVGIWDFPIFELEQKAGNHILSQMAFTLFQESGLMETFQIPHREFINFFRFLEANYGSNVYHNKTHAADVLHGVSYLLFEIIPGFSHAFSGASEREWKLPSHGKNHGRNIASAFSILEVFACYMAAAMHDFDHPGRTNAFLVATKSPLAILYNDRSVLENHHAAASWDLLTCVPAHNILAYLDEAEMKRFRFLVVEAILATDLKLHFEILANFKTKTHPEDGEGIDWMSEVDRLMVMKMLIKMADINTPTKSYELHRAWTKRITEEFYQQAEEEEHLGLPPTIFMDRKHPEKLPAIQLSFIQHLVSPLFQASATAGIIPGILEATSVLPEEKNDDSEQKEEGLEVGDDAFTIQGDSSPSEKFMSILLTNLEVNYEGWRADLPAEENPTEKTEEEESSIGADSASTAEPEDEDDMATPTCTPSSSAAAFPTVTITSE